MVYGTSYASGQKPFLPDLQRGKWLRPSDFIFACLGLTLKLDFTVVWSLDGTGGKIEESNFFYLQNSYELTILLLLILFILLSCIDMYNIYALTVVFYIFSMMITHSFLGQFSSSGFVTALRISPIFKGVGYIGLGLGVLNLMYHCVFVALPIVYLFNSFRTTLPWSFESWSEWAVNRTEEEKLDICTWDYNLMDTRINDTNNRLYTICDVFSHFEELKYFDTSEEHELSWNLLSYLLIVSAIIFYIFYKFSEPIKFGTLLRNVVGYTFILALICFVTLMQLPKAFSGIIHDMRSFNLFQDIYTAFAPVLVFVMQSLGSGFGSIIALSSFNSFNTDIIRYSWIICVGQCLSYVMFSIYLSRFTHFYNQFKLRDEVMLMFDYRSMLFVASGSAIATLKRANLWSILYYSMLVMASLIVMVIQIFTVLNSLFDEFESLRLYKKEVTFGFISSLTLGSIYFATSQGIEHFPVLCYDCMAIQAILNFLLLVAALWFYGRVRLQHDIEFMLGQHFATWRVQILRILTPVGFVLTLFFMLIIIYYEHLFHNNYMHFISALLLSILILVVPGTGVIRPINLRGIFVNISKEHASQLIGIL